MKYCIHSEALTNAEQRVLTSHGYRTVALTKSERISTPVCDHPDLCLLLLVGCAYTTDEHAAYLEENLPALPLYTLRESRAPGYPREAALCVLTIGCHAFLNPRCTPDEVRRALEKGGYTIHEVKQGYAACTVLALDTSHAITADPTMARALTDAGIEVLFIEDGDILLPPYPHGFIGGASGVDANTLYTVGDLHLHRSAESILAFVERLGMRVVSLSGGMLRDCGRLLFFEDDL